MCLACVRLVNHDDMELISNVSYAKNENGVWTFTDLFGHVAYAIGNVKSISFESSVIELEGNQVDALPS